MPDNLKWSDGESRQRIGFKEPIDDGNDRLFYETKASMKKKGDNIMIKNKQELKKEISTHARRQNYLGEYNIEISVLDSILEQVEEVERPVMPKWFDDWYKGITKGFPTKSSKEEAIFLISRCGYGYSLNKSYPDGSKVEEISSTAFIVSNKLKAIEAVVNGYEVKEQLYIVKFPKSEMVLGYYDGDGISCWEIISENIVRCNDNWKYKFTEKEINDYEKSYWHLAVPVEELDE